MLLHTALKQGSLGDNYATRRAVHIPTDNLLLPVLASTAFTQTSDSLGCNGFHQMGWGRRPLWIKIHDPSPLAKPLNTPQDLIPNGDQNHLHTKLRT